MEKHNIIRNSEQSQSIAAGIVTYNPDTERLQESIESIVHQVNKLYIFDNASKNVEEIENIVTRNCAIELVKSESNCGIAYALNRLFEYAKSDGYIWLLTLDQDSVCVPNLISIYKKHLEEADSLTSLRKDRNINIEGDEDYQIHEVKRCITSGNMVRIDAWEENRGFNERLFIDMVDYDFCYRLLINGFRIVQIGFFGILHELGDGQHEKIMGKEIFTGSYNPIRKYYYTRNTIYIQLKYHPNNKFLSSRWLIALVLHTVLKENNKFKKCKAIAKGFIDGFRQFNYIEGYFMESIKNTVE